MAFRRAECLGLAVILTLVTSFLSRTTTYKDLKVGWIENGLLLLTIATLAGWSIVAGLEHPPSILFPSLVLLAGGLVLFLLYLLDRFYYSSLLLGAVARARCLEKELKLSLTEDISKVSPPWTYTVLPGILYLVPCLILANLAMGVAALSGAPGPERVFLA